MDDLEGAFRVLTPEYLSISLFSLSKYFKRHSQSSGVINQEFCSPERQENSDGWQQHCNAKDVETKAGVNGVQMKPILK